MGLGDPPGTQPRTHIWDHLVTQGDYLDWQDGGQRVMGRRGGGVCTHRCPGLPSPWEEKSPPTAPSPKKPQSTPEAPASSPSSWVTHKPGLKGLQPPWNKPGTNPFTKSSSQRHPEVKPSAPTGFSRHMLCLQGEKRASCSQPGVSQHWGRAVPLGTRTPGQPALLCPGPEELLVEGVWAKLCKV